MYTAGTVRLQRHFQINQNVVENRSVIEEIESKPGFKLFRLQNTIFFTMLYREVNVTIRYKSWKEAVAKRLLNVAKSA